MQRVSKNKITELKTILTKMSLEVCCALALPEFELSWRDVTKAVRNSKLQMVPASIARILCRYASSTMSPEELSDLVAKLRLKLIATQTRMWHVIRLTDPIDEPVDTLSRDLPTRLLQTIRSSKGYRNMRPEVQIVKLSDLIYISVQMLSDVKDGTVLYMAVPHGQQVALVSAVRSGLLKICVRGLGYQNYEDVSLNGRDIDSLLRIYNTGNTGRADHLSGLPEYKVMPVITKSGIDYTGKTYDEKYVQEVIGPNPPVLTKLTLTSEKEFFDPERLNKKMKLTVNLKSDDVAKSLCSWAKLGAIPPTSELFHIFHKIKSNKFSYTADENDL